MAIEDRTAYFADFGVVATIGGNPVRVIFDNEYMAQLDVESSNPVAQAQSSDLVGVSHGTSIDIHAGDFNEAFTGTVIGEPKPDGTGFAYLELASS